MVELRNRTKRIGTILLLTVFGVGTASADDFRASYRLEISIDWSANLAPFEFPDGAHLSTLIGLTHGDGVNLFQDGATASSGLELVAENGRTGILKAQFDELTRKKRIGAIVEANEIDSVPGRTSTTFTTTKDHPLLSVITMLAPSPDWFTGVSAVGLYSDDGWLDVIELPLWVWDAGTDSGETFKSRNEDTQPHESIRLLSSKHFLNSSGLIKFGSILIKRQS